MADWVRVSSGRVRFLQHLQHIQCSAAGGCIGASLRAGVPPSPCDRTATDPPPRWHPAALFIHCPLGGSGGVSRHRAAIAVEHAGDPIGDDVEKAAGDGTAGDTGRCRASSHLVESGDGASLVDLAELPSGASGPSVIRRTGLGFFVQPIDRSIIVPSGK